MARILDTDTCIEILRGNRRVIETRRTVRDEVCTTWITASELYYGAAKSDRAAHNKALVDLFLDPLPIHGIQRFSAQYFGALKTQLESAGNRIADADLWIASIAKERRAILVTGNTRHYDRIEGLSIENWIR